MLTIEKLKEAYIDEALKNSGLPFVVFTDAGDFENARRSGNSVTEYINGLLTVSNSSVEYAGEQEIVGISTELGFLFRLDDDEDAGGGFRSAKELRDALQRAFASVPPRFNVTDGEKTYTVVAAYSLPETGTRLQRPALGDSLSYSCTIYFAYLANAINATDVKITIDGEDVNFLAFGLTRRPVIVANLFSNNVNGEATGYAESTAFVLDLTMPAFVSVMGGIVADYVMGISDANKPHAVKIAYGTGKTMTRTMIFGESSSNGQGLENVRCTVSLVPYSPAATIGG